MPAPHITPLPTPPSRSQSPDTFSTDADAFLGALPEFQTDANTQADYLDGLADQVTLDAASANAAAAVATGVANYQGDYSAIVTYQIGDSVSYNGRRYVAKTVNTGITPSDGANWFLINDGDVLGPVSATNNALVLFDGTTGKFIKGGIGNGTLGALLSSGGNGNPPVFLAQGTSGQVLTSAGEGAPTWQSVLPDQTGNSGKFLSTNGTTTSWSAINSGVAGDPRTVISEKDANFGASINNFYGAAALSATLQVLFVSSSSTIYAVAYDNSTDTLGNPVAVGVPDYGLGIAKISGTQLIIGYGSSTNDFNSRVLTVSGTTITAGAVATQASRGGPMGDPILIGSTYIFSTAISAGGAYIIPVSVSGSTVTIGTAVTLSTNTATNLKNIPIVKYSGTTGVVFVYNSSTTQAVAFTVSGLTITIGTAVGFGVPDSHAVSYYNLPNGKIAIVFQVSNSSVYTGFISVSGTTVTATTCTTTVSSNTSVCSVLFGNDVLICAGAYSASGGIQAFVHTDAGGTVSPTTVSSSGSSVIPTETGIFVSSQVSGSTPNRFITATSGSIVISNQTRLGALNPVGAQFGVQVMPFPIGPTTSRDYWSYLLNNTFYLRSRMFKGASSKYYNFSSASSGISVSADPVNFKCDAVLLNTFASSHVVICPDNTTGGYIWHSYSDGISTTRFYRMVVA